MNSTVPGSADRPAELMPVDAPPQIIISPSRSYFIDFKELFEYKELFFILIWRDIKVRYKQTIIGFAWAIAQPIMSMVVFTLFFGKLANIPSEGVPYPLFSFAALLPWQFFGKALSDGSTSLTTSGGILSKVYFPRIVLPGASVLSGLVDLAVGFIVFLALMLYFDVMPTWRMIFVPAFVFLAVLTAMSVSVWLSALDVLYRDVRYILPFLLQFWMFCTPVIYPASLLPEKWRVVYALNPMVGVIEGFRWSTLGTAHSPDLTMLAVSAGVMVALLAGGLVFFRRMEASIADRL